MKCINKHDVKVIQKDEREDLKMGKVRQACWDLISGRPNKWED